jgi:quercetin dioxygenase-like cupin family protein
MNMKIIPYTDVKATHFDNDKAKGVAGRVVIGKNDGANNFCMRVFEVSAGGHTPKHSHEWEHEIFFHAGEGEIFNKGQWKPVKAGNVAFVPGNEEHQIRNSGKALLVFACLIPSTAPEL